ncbi:VQ motif-containing protein 17 [Vitis vinifera]|uniref:VQ motif-containing protein 17 n=1 Tax=Vitis vinifera TaxID=29760 RepID=A0A438D5G3_VITVI|nr:VQ motif-containing protein 17 [Vitis vinifera]
MEEMMAGREGCNPNSTPSPLPMHNRSHTISKVKPKIRIIHIFAPEIIKTDVENFRELVQRLTGKPSAADKGCRKKNMARGVVCNKGVGKKKTAEFRGLESRERIKGEEHIWGGENSGGFLSGFGDLDGFMQEFGEFPLLPLDVSATHMHGFGEAQLS